jgi:hypothetical protein
VKKIYVFLLLFSAQLISMERSPTPDELKIVQAALEQENITYDAQSMRAVRKPCMNNLFEVDKNKVRYLVDTRAKAVVNKYVIAERPATC